MSIKYSTANGRELNTVSLHPHLGLPEGWDEFVYEKEGFELIHVYISGNGPTPFGEYIYRKDRIDVPLNKAANMITRSYSRLGNVKLVGKDFNKARKALMGKYPMFKWYVEGVKIKHKESGTLMVIKNKGIDSKKGDKRRNFVVVHLNGKQPKASDIPYMLNLLGDLTNDLCSRKACEHTAEVVCPVMSEKEYLMAHKKSHK